MYNIQNNFQINNQYNMMGNSPNYNKLTVTFSCGFSQKEIENLKNIIVKAVSKYDDYQDIGRYIYDDIENNKGRWSIVVGLRDNVNTLRAAPDGILVVNIGKYKIIIDYYK